LEGFRKEKVEREGDIELKQREIRRKEKKNQERELRENRV